jgi:hypothetical protein
VTCKGLQACTCSSCRWIRLLCLYSSSLIQNRSLLQKIPTVGAKETCTCTLIEAKKTFKCKLQLEQARTCAPTSHPHFTPHTPHTLARTDTHKHTQTHKRHMCGRYLSISRSLERYGHQRPRNLRNLEVQSTFDCRYRKELQVLQKVNVQRSKHG